MFQPSTDSNFSEWTFPKTCHVFVSETCHVFDSEGFWSLRGKAEEVYEQANDGNWRQETHFRWGRTKSKNFKQFYFKFENKINFIPFIKLKRNLKWFNSVWLCAKWKVPLMITYWSCNSGHIHQRLFVWWLHT